jgi:hypothetical protein
MFYNALYLCFSTCAVVLVCVTCVEYLLHDSLLYRVILPLEAPDYGL